MQKSANSAMFNMDACGEFKLARCALQKRVKTNSRLFFPLYYRRRAPSCHLFLARQKCENRAIFLARTAATCRSHLSAFGEF
ncbi:hypothetical protein FKM82_017836 [Ascaphus truei]